MHPLSLFETSTALSGSQPAYSRRLFSLLRGVHQEIAFIGCAILSGGFGGKQQRAFRQIAVVKARQVWLFESAAKLTSHNPVLFSASLPKSIINLLVTACSSKFK
jgi:hypothetical protein